MITPWTLAAVLLAAPASPDEPARQACALTVAEGSLMMVEGAGAQAAQRIAPCHALPEARVLLCSLAQPLGPPALADTCAATLEEPRWAAEAWLVTGLRRMQTGDLVGARRDLLVATSHAPSFALPYVARVLIADAAGDPKTAQAEARALVAHFGDVRCPADLALDDPRRLAAGAVESIVRREDPECARCWGRLAYLYAQWALRRPDAVNEPIWREATAALREVVARDAGDFDTRLTLGDTLGMLEDRQGQYQVYMEGLALRGNWYQGLLEAGRAAMALGRPAEAISLLERATGVQPETGAAWSWLGTARRALGRPDAVEAHRRAVAAPNPRPETRLELARDLLADGHAAEARAEFAHVTQRLPEVASGWYGLSRALQALGQKAEADEAFAQYQKTLDAERTRIEKQERIHNLSRSSAAVLERLATGDLRGARKQLAIVVNNDPTFPFAAFVRAAVAARAGRKPEPADLDAVIELCRAANAGSRKQTP